MPYARPHHTVREQHRADAATGGKKWSFTAGGRLYVTCEDGSLRCFSSDR